MREVGDLILIFKGTWEFFMETCEITSEEDEKRLKGAERLGKKIRMKKAWNGSREFNIKIYI